MKKLIVILLLIPMFSFGQIVDLSYDKYWQQDKAKHFTISMAMTLGAIEVAKGANFKHPEVAGIFAALTVGFIKECVEDQYPSGKDLLANFTGVVAGYYLNRLIFKNRK